MSTEATYTSPVTGKLASLIGWVETNDVNKATIRHTRFKVIAKSWARFKTAH
jgi:hypothetical protein